MESPSLDAPKTKAAAAMLAKMGLQGKTVLFVTAEEETMLYKSVRNLDRVDVIPAYQLNAYQVLRNDSLVLTEAALKRVEEVFGS